MNQDNIGSQLPEPQKDLLPVEGDLLPRVEPRGDLDAAAPVGGQEGVLSEIPVLPGVQEADVVPQVAQGLEDGSNLDALGPGTGNDSDMHALQDTMNAVQEQADSQVFQEHFSPKAITAQEGLWSWQRMVAAWYATVPYATPKSILRYARDLTKLEVTPGAIRALFERKDFQQLVEQFKAAPSLRIREIAEFDYNFYLDAHRQGLQMAIAANDHRGIPAYTTPMLDRMLPKKAEGDQRAQVVVVNLTPGQAKSISISDVQEAQIMEIEE